MVFAPCATTYASLIIDQAASLNVTFPLMAGDTWESSVILDAAKGKNIDVYVSTFFAEDETNPAAVEFVNGFKACAEREPRQDDEQWRQRHCGGCIRAGL